MSGLTGKAQQELGERRIWFARAVRASAVLACLLAARTAVARDFFVRTDGNDSNAGTSNTATGAWKSLAKCVGVLTGGDTCWIQPGIYYTSPNVTESTSGGYLDNAAADCTCTKGSTAVTCTNNAANFSAGDLIQCDTGYGFFYTEITSRSGNDIVLEEPYPGPSASADTADRLRPIRFIGANGTTPVADPLDVVITTFKDAPSDITWTQDSTYPFVYYYNTANTADPLWKPPVHLREVAGTFRQAVAAWDMYDASWSPSGKNGLDSYYKYPNANNCPCARSSVKASVADVAGSYGVDGTTIYVHTYHGVSPATLTMQASSASNSTGVLTIAADNIVVSNLTLEHSSNENPESGLAGMGLYLGSGANQRIKIKDVRVHGRLNWLSGIGAVDVRIENVLAAAGFNAEGTGMSGVMFNNFEIRGSHGNGWSSDNLSGVSPADPIIIDRLYLHRTFSDLNTVACGFQDEWVCAEVPGRQKNDPYWGTHGLYLGTSLTPDRALSNLLIQNSIWEYTYDGLGIFVGGGDNSVIVRNCTFGLGGEYMLTGTSSDPGTHLQIYNTLFLRLNPNKRPLQLYTDPNVAHPTSNYNALYVQDTSGANVPANMSWWNVPNIGSYTLNQVRQNYGQEANSIVVCSSGCSGTGAFNKSNPYADFIRTSTSGGVRSNYTPVAGAAVIDRGLNTQCPATDFYGNPRRDGHCDIGAVEYQGNAADTTPPASVTAFGALGQSSSVALSWVNASSSDSTGALVKVRTDHLPTSPTDGTDACRRDGVPGSPGSCTFTPATNGTLYYFAAFSYDMAGNYGAGVGVSAEAGGNVPNAPSDVRRSDTIP
jgi:hypothetical protein